MQLKESSGYHVKQMTSTLYIIRHKNSQVFDWNESSLIPLNFTKFYGGLTSKLWENITPHFAFLSSHKEHFGSSIKCECLFYMQKLYPLQLDVVRRDIKLCVLALSHTFPVAWLIHFWHNMYYYLLCLQHMQCM